MHCNQKRVREKIFSLKYKQITNHNYIDESAGVGQLWLWWSRWWDFSHQRAYRSSHRWYMMSMERYCEITSTEDSFTRALWQSYQQSSSSKGGGNGGICLTNYLFHNSRALVGSLTCRKIFGHGTVSFTFPPKEDVLQILQPLKIHRPWPGLNPRTLGSIQSTLTTRPPRTTHGNCNADFFLIMNFLSKHPSETLDIYVLQHSKHKKN
jgi:hypothetical protein